MNMLTKLTTEDGNENKGVLQDDPDASEVADDKDLSIDWLKISKL
jgi:hypothetical protein